MFQDIIKSGFNKRLPINYKQCRHQKAAPKPAEACANIWRKPCIPDMSSLDPNCPQPRVVIVGAGLAGLSAAHRLISCGLNNVVVLEAQDRPGGRIYTEKYGDVSVDLGAGWIFGACAGNPVFALACQEGAIQRPTARSKIFQGNCFDSGADFIKSKVYKSAGHLFDEIKLSAKRKYHALPANMSLWAYFDSQIKEVVKLFPQTDQRAAEKVMYGMTNELRHTVGAPLECVSLSRFGIMKNYPGATVAVKSGMSRILSPLLRVITENRIKYNKVVTKIFWDQISPDKPRITVVTNDGKVEKADYAIITVPLGVLKVANEQMFSPPLPEVKKTAIQTLGIGHTAIIILKYAKPFWLKGEGHIRMCWSKKELEDRCHWIKSVNLIQEIPTSNDMLHLAVSGPEAVEVECLNECDLARDVTGMIRRFLGNSTIPMPSAIFRRPWVNNEFIKGAITYLGQGCTVRDVANLAQPIPDLGLDSVPSLFFAGDGCTARHVGLTGARLSGISEAERILNLTKCFCGPPPRPQQLFKFGC